VDVIADLRPPIWRRWLARRWQCVLLVVLLLALAVREACPRSFVASSTTKVGRVGR
jgi:hypothetical protein